MDKKNIRIIIADDHQLVIDGIRSILEKEDVIILGEARDGKELIEKIKDLTPDIVLLDINMPGMDGVEATRRINMLFKKVKILILSTYDDIRLIKEILKLGAQGYVLKTATRTELIKAIYALDEGHTYFSREISDKVLHNLMKENTQSDSNSALPPVGLTKREREILKYIAMEFSGPQIAKELHISINTVETHRKNLFRKTKSKGTVGLVKYAMKHDMI